MAAFFCRKPRKLQGTTRFWGPTLARCWPKWPNTHGLFVVFRPPKKTLGFWPFWPSNGRFGAPKVGFALYFTGFLQRAESPVNSGLCRTCRKPCKIQGKTHVCGPKLAMRWPKWSNTHGLLRVVFLTLKKLCFVGHVGRWPI